MEACVCQASCVCLTELKHNVATSVHAIPRFRTRVYEVCLHALSVERDGLCAYVFLSVHLNVSRCLCGCTSLRF